MDHGKNIERVDELVKQEPIPFEKSGGDIVTGQEKDRHENEGPETPELKTLWAAGKTELEEVKKRNTAKNLRGNVAESGEGAGLTGFPANRQENLEKINSRKEPGERLGKDNEGEEIEGQGAQKSGLVKKGKNNRRQEASVKNQGFNFGQMQVHGAVPFRDGLIWSVP